MRKLAVLVLFFFLFSFSLSSLAYARKYEYEHTYRYYRYESFRPLIWAGAVYIGVLAAKELFFLPEEKVMKEKEIELINLEIQKKKKEIEFIYNPPRGWKRTPWGKKFLTELSSQQYFFEE